jgi:raffinose/stachyose/melibiose transport system permease protein
MFIPSVGMVTMISLYQKLHLYNSLIGLILGGSVSGLAFNLFILLGFFRTVPRELEEAAVIDGCNSMQSLFYVLIPVVKPALVTLAIFAFVSNWNSLMGPLLLLRNSELYTIPIGLLSFRGSYSIEYNLMFASILMTSLPLVILYIKFQKYFIEALSGGIKG